jgi:hypothetical protein
MIINSESDAHNNWIEEDFGGAVGSDIFLGIPWKGYSPAFPP